MSSPEETRDARLDRTTGADVQRYLRRPAGQAMGRGMIPYPNGVASVDMAWEEATRRHYQALRQAEEEQREGEAPAILKSPTKVVEIVVGMLAEAASRVFGGRLGGKPAARLLGKRLRAMPRPEVALMAAVLLGAPLNEWLDAARQEEGGGVGS